MNCQIAFCGDGVRDAGESCDGRTPPHVQHVATHDGREEPWQ